MGTTWNNPISASASSILTSRLGQRSAAATSKLASGSFAEVTASGSAVSTGRGGDILNYIFKADRTYQYRAFFDGVMMDGALKSILTKRGGMR